MCGEIEGTEHIIECKMVREVIKEEIKKEWIRNGNIEELKKVTNYIKEYIDERERSGN